MVKYATLSKKKKKKQNCSETCACPPLGGGKFTKFVPGDQCDSFIIFISTPMIRKTSEPDDQKNVEDNFIARCKVRQ